MVDTIAAIATPPGQGGIAIVRVSGPAAREVVGRLFRRSGGRTGMPEPRRVYLGELLAAPGGPALDQVLAFAMPGPRSYTGEDVVEVQCHGGTIVSRRILESILAAGARAAEPGEFTKRALLNGRLDLAQAEAVADLIAARTEAGRRLAWSQLDGVLSARVGALRDAILAVRARCEAALDFPEEDDVVAALAGDALARECARVRREIDGLVAGFERGRLRYEGARVALVGKPNVGKSSLLNALAGRERAIVTAVAGTTRDVVEATVALAVGPVVIADTAGLRAAGDEIEALGVARSRAAIADAACTVAVFDGAAPLDADDRAVAAAVRGRPSVALVNKSDLPSRVPTAALADLLPGVPIVRASALTRAGLDGLGAALGAVLAGGEEAPEDEVAIYRARHRDATRRASDEVARAERGIAAGAGAELIASDLAAAAEALGTITGEVTTEDVLDRIFGEFCIGK